MKSAKVLAGQSALATQYNDLRADAYASSMLLPHAQATPGMTLYVEAGIIYIGGVKVAYAGGNTPSFGAPSSYPRIDIVTIDSAGTIAISQGSENSSPVVPTYPADKIVLCEVYNRVGETSIKDSDDSTNGYISNDVRPLISNPTNPGAIADSLLPDADNTHDLGSAIKEWANVFAVKFFGDGSGITNLTVQNTGKTFTSGEAINAGSTPQAVYIKESDGKVYKTVASGDESIYKFIGFVAGAQNVGANASVVVTTQGIISGFTGLAQNGMYYLGTSGAISTTPNATRPLKVGFALSATTLLIVAGLKVLPFSTNAAVGTTLLTNTITTGFKPRLIVGVVNAAAGDNVTTGTHSVFIVEGSGGANYSGTFKGDSSITGISTSRIGVMYAGGGSGDIVINNITESSFDVVFHRFNSGTGVGSATVAGVILGE